MSSLVDRLNFGFNMGLSILAVVLGAVAWLVNGEQFIFSVFSLPFYWIFPWSMVIFGTLGAINSLFHENGLLTAITAGMLFDMTGSISARLHADWMLLALWILTIAIGFIVSRKSLLRFFLNPAFLGYLAILTLFRLGLVFQTLTGAQSEMLIESFFCLAFYISFYGFTLPR